MTVNSIIVDDEENSRIVLDNMLTNFCTNIKVVAHADSVQAALKALKQHKADLIFLDIEMPVENGFRLFEYIEAINFGVIFTTAYEQYAVKAFKFSPIDYLLKPIDLHKLRAAIKKFRTKQHKAIHQKRVNNLRYNFNHAFRKLALPTTEGFIFVELENIIRFEAASNYSLVFLKNGQKYLISKTLREYENLLQGLNFFRLNRSHLINFNYIKKYKRAKRPIIEMMDGSNLNLTPARKKEFLEKLDRFY